MSLLTPPAKTSAALAHISEEMAAHLTNAAILANRQGDTLTSLPTDALNEWLASIGSELENLLTAHAATVTAVNGALDVATAILAASGITPPAIRADARPFAERIAATNRTFADGVVVDNPAPEPPVVEDPTVEDPAPEPAP